MWTKATVVDCDRHLSSDLYSVSPEGVLAWNLECGGLIKDSVIIGPLIGNYVVQYTGNWRIINWVMVSPPPVDATISTSAHTTMTCVIDGLFGICRLDLPRRELLYVQTISMSHG